MANHGAGPSHFGIMESPKIGEQKGHNATDALHLQLSEKEREILQLFNRLEEIQLDTIILQAQETVPYDPSEIVSDKDIQDAQEKLLEAKARYALKNTIIENVLTANPVLKAIHAGHSATPIERDLQPLIEERDDLSASLTETAARVLSSTDKLTKLEAEHVVAARRNAELAAKVISLAEEADSQKRDDIKDPKLRAQLDELESSLKISRQRWRIMKGTASAVVAGSGVDWSRDPVLRELVLDNEDD